MPRSPLLAPTLPWVAALALACASQSLAEPDARAPETALPQAEEETALGSSEATEPAHAAPASAVAPSVNQPPSMRSTDAGWEMKAVLNAELLALRARAQRRVLGNAKIIEDEHGRSVELSPIPRDANGAPAWRNGNSLGNFVAIENEAALEHFHQRLEELATGRQQRVRILAFGASHTQGDLYTGYLRHYLQSRFGNGGPGFMQMAQLNPFYRKLDFKVESQGFKIEHAQKKEPPEHGRFGLFGAAAVGRFPYAYARVFPIDAEDRELAVNRYELYYAAEPRGGDLLLRVSKDKPIRISTTSAEYEPRYHAFETGLGWHEIEVRPAGNGPVRIFGLSMERSLPGLVIDTLGINGTRAANMLTWDKTFFHPQLARRAPDLLLLAYGTNEAVDRGQPIADYETNLRRVLSDLRSVAPATSCVLVGPGDFPQGKDDHWTTRPRLLQIIDVQRKVAPDYGCGFWDTFEFMGGEGSMREWVLAKPPLASPDHIHLNARGYVKMGMALGDALMRAYDEFHLIDRPVPREVSRR